MLFSLDNRLMAAGIRVERKVGRAELQTARLEAALRTIAGLAAASSPAQGAGAGAEVEERPAAFTQSARQVPHPADSAPHVAAGFRPSPAAGKSVQQPQGAASNAPQHGLTLVAISERESGRSEWGKRTAARIARSYEVDPFFARLNGSLGTDCRLKTFLNTWAVPVVDSGDPALAQLELMALAAQKEPPARRMHSVRRPEHGRTVTNLDVKRRSPPSSAALFSPTA